MSSLGFMTESSQEMDGEQGSLTEGRESQRTKSRTHNCQREAYIGIFDKEFNGEFMRQVIVYPGEDGYWVAECPSLPGCISQGKNKEEALVNIREGIEGYIAVLQEDHLPVPPEKFEALLVAI
jgi:predicted RNase H-like HicB family nuclease